LYTAECENHKKQKDSRKYSQRQIVAGRGTAIAKGVISAIASTSSVAAMDAPQIYPPYKEDHFSSMRQLSCAVRYGVYP
jgi:hypothetical protein